MNSNIIIEASDVWDYFYDNKEELVKMMHLIASNDDFGIKIYVTEQDGCPCIMAFADDDCIYDDTANNKIDCKEIVEEVYDMYLTVYAIDNLTGVKNDSDAEEKEIEIEHRETELDDAVWDFVAIAVEGAEGTSEQPQEHNFDRNLLTAEVLDDCKEHFLAYLYLKFGINIYRPMVVEYDDSTEEYLEYPYESLDIPDADSPVYK